MPLVNSRETLKQYCLRALGAPVLEINVDDDQLEDRLEEALEYWKIYHYDGIERIYLKHVITEEDVVNKYVPLSDAIYGVTRVIPMSQTSSSKNIFDIQYQLRLHDLYDLSSTSIIYFKSVMAHISLLDFELNGPQLYRFNRLTNKLFIDAKWGAELIVGTIVVVECYRAMDPEANTRVYSEPWLKKYTTALFKRQWGQNLSKFTGIQLPGGVTLDGDKIFQAGSDEIKELEDEMLNKSAPLDMFIG